MKWRLTPPVHPLHLALGLLLWFLWFSVLYGGVAVACVVAPPPAPHTVFNAINGAGLAFTALTAAVFGWACRAALRATRQLGAGPADARPRFVARLAVALYAVSALATVVVGLPLLVVPPCV